MTKYPTIEKYKDFNVSKGYIAPFTSELTSAILVAIMFLIMCSVLFYMGLEIMGVITIFILCTIGYFLLYKSRYPIVGQNQKDKDRDLILLGNEYEKAFKEMTSYGFYYVIKNILSNFNYNVIDRKFEDAKINFNKKDFILFIRTKTKDDTYKDGYKYEEFKYEKSCEFNELIESYKILKENNIKEKEFKKRRIFN